MQRACCALSAEHGCHACVATEAHLPASSSGSSSSSSSSSSTSVEAVAAAARPCSSHAADGLGLPSPPSLCLSALRNEFKIYTALITACWDAEPRNRPDMDQVVRVTADCTVAIEADSFSRQQQQQQQQQEALAGQSSTPRQGLRSLTGALASKLSLSGRPSSRGSGGGN